MCAFFLFLIVIGPYIWGFIWGNLLKLYCILTGTPANPWAIGG